jgi:hypothetical protein
MNNLESFEREDRKEFLNVMKVFIVIVNVIAWVTIITLIHLSYIRGGDSAAGGLAAVLMLICFLTWTMWPSKAEYKRL